MFYKLTGNDQFRFALIFGKLDQNTAIASHLFVPTPGEISACNFPRFLPNSSNQEVLPVIGCIANSLTVLSNRNFFKNFRLNEMLCILCPYGWTKNLVLHLINMNIYGGPPANINDERTPPITVCNHLEITDTLTASIFNRN